MTINCKTIGCRIDALSGEDHCYFCSKRLPLLATLPVKEQPKTPEYTGRSVSYYSVGISDPMSGGAPYVAECGDIIEFLGMDYNEGNAFKAIWRKCAARTLGLKKAGYKDGMYDSEKVAYFGERMVTVTARKLEEASPPSEESTETVPDK